MPVTDQDLRALTYLARRLRDETHGCRQWDEVGTFACFKDALAGQNLLIAAQRVLGHATDPQAQTPGAIKRPFTPDPTDAPIRKPFDPDETCGDCSLPELACRERWGNHPDGHQFISATQRWRQRVSGQPTTSGAERARAALAEAEKCHHGVRPVACLDCAKPKPAATEEDAEHVKKIRAQLRGATTEETQ